MSWVFPDRLQVDGLLYHTDAAPLEPYLAALPVQPPRNITPFSQRGYVATWTIHEEIMYLTEISSDAHAMLFAEWSGPVAATWFSGFIHGGRGDRRYTGYPPRIFRNDEIVLELEDGRVMRKWVVDLRSVPDQTREELRLSLQASLLKFVLDDGGNE